MANGSLLLTKEKESQKWWIPGGKHKDGETPTQTAIRELWEETGVTEAMLRVYEEPMPIGKFVCENGNSMTHVFKVTLPDTAAVTLRDPRDTYDNGI
jgi:8-oxo-dGTP pyrophosphatase MutT (NUDIX family)